MNESLRTAKTHRKFINKWLNRKLHENTVEVSLHGKKCVYIHMHTHIHQYI